uniref:Protein-S-isoprenylcysteine O-methyltransferase n=1 Tax=Toxoplasma gondii COUG TaxID=1074873 RepID=A0A2G8XMU7_TOXGO|nr:isoprenylcysteine carboxyl methyltransferase (icmt) family protein [Toxoplasma gondii COUG]
MASASPSSWREETSSLDSLSSRAGRKSPVSRLSSSRPYRASSVALLLCFLLGCLLGVHWATQNAGLSAAASSERVVSSLVSAHPLLSSLSFSSLFSHGLPWTAAFHTVPASLLSHIYRAADFETEESRRGEKEHTTVNSSPAARIPRRPHSSRWTSRTPVEAAANESREADSPSSSSSSSPPSSLLSWIVSFLRILSGSGEGQFSASSFCPLNLSWAFFLAAALLPRNAAAPVSEAGIDLSKKRELSPVASRALSLFFDKGEEGEEEDPNAGPLRPLHFQGRGAATAKEKRKLESPPDQKNGGASGKKKTRGQSEQAQKGGGVEEEEAEEVEDEVEEEDGGCERGDGISGGEEAEAREGKKSAVSVCGGVVAVEEVYVQGSILFGLGWIFAFFGAKTVFGCGPLWVQVEGLFLFLVSLHHLTEFFFVFFYHPQSLSVDSFLLNNTCAYTLALVLSVAELRLRASLLRGGREPEAGPVEETPVNLLRDTLASASLLLRRCLAWIGDSEQAGDTRTRASHSQTWSGSPPASLSSFSDSSLSSSLSSFSSFSSSSFFSSMSSPSPRSSLSLASMPSPFLEGSNVESSCLRETAGVLAGAERGRLGGAGVVDSLASLLSLLGLLLACGGLLLRLCAFATAGRNFTHQIATTRRPSHALVTRGVYGVYRHPAYTGWFYWAVGSQVAIGNVVCMLLFAAVSFVFFRDRILYEEQLLETMFPGTYCAYRAATPRLGIPLLQAAVRRVQVKKTPGTVDD